MKSVAIFGNVRANLGKADSRELRLQGKVPCVLYGGKENVHFSVYASDFKELVYTPNTYLVKLDIDGTQYRASLQDMQFHAVNDTITHADFLQVFDLGFRSVAAIAAGSVHGDVFFDDAAEQLAVPEHHQSGRRRNRGPGRLRAGGPR